MKRDVLLAASTMLTIDEQRMLLRLSEAPLEDGPVVAYDMDVRSGMCAALTELGGAINALLFLLEENRVPEGLGVEARAAYAALMDRIGEAAVRATDMVERSRSFDDDALVAMSPEATHICQ